MSDEELTEIGQILSSALPADSGTNGAWPDKLPEQIEGLARLHRDGVLTDGEFIRAKARLFTSDIEEANGGFLHFIWVESV